MKARVEKIGRFNLLFDKYASNKEFESINAFVVRNKDDSLSLQLNLKSTDHFKAVLEASALLFMIEHGSKFVSKSAVAMAAIKEEGLDEALFI